jgi:hypothetical protein
MCYAVLHVWVGAGVVLGDDEIVGKNNNGGTNSMLTFRLPTAVAGLSIVAPVSLWRLTGSVEL